MEFNPDSLHGKSLVSIGAKWQKLTYLSAGCIDVLLHLLSLVTDEMPCPEQLIEERGYWGSQIQTVSP